MFAGVGCFSIIITKHSGAAKVYSIDVNPAAFQFLKDNIKLNRVFGKVVPILGDAKEVINDKFSHVADRVLMPLPEKAFEYLPYALLTLKKLEDGYNTAILSMHGKMRIQLRRQRRRLPKNSRIWEHPLNLRSGGLLEQLVSDGTRQFWISELSRVKAFYSYKRKYIRRERDIKKKLMDILACPIDKYHPLELHIFEEKNEIVEGLIVCPKCLRWYPIREEIPEMLPDELRKESEDLPFFKKWKEKIPERILKEGKPFNVGGQSTKKP